MSPAQPLETLVTVAVLCFNVHIHSVRPKRAGIAFRSFSRVFSELSAHHWYMVEAHLWNEWIHIHLPDLILPARSRIIVPISLDAQQIDFPHLVGINSLAYFISQELRAQRSEIICIQPGFAPEH